MADRCLLKALLETNATTETDVDWDRLPGSTGQPHNAVGSRMRWDKLKSTVCSEVAPCFRNQLQLVRTTYMPDLPEPVPDPPRPPQPASELHDVLFQTESSMTDGAAVAPSHKKASKAAQPLERPRARQTGAARASTPQQGDRKLTTKASLEIY